MDNIKRKRCRRRKLSESDEGVATTVGTIMALLVFLSLLSLITQQYIPVWMKDKEAYHVDEVMGQFTQIKGTVDTLVINEHTDYSMYSTVTLGSEGVPLFASRSMGVIRLLPDEGGMNLRFNENGTNRLRNFNSEGSLALETRNRYFEEQTIVYENGAIILQQEEDSILRAPPQLTIQDGDIDIHIIDIQGEETRLGGSRNIGVATELWGTSRASYSNPEDVTIQIDTENTGGWERWLISETDLEAGDIDEENGTLSFDIDDINSLSVTYSTIHMKIST